MGKKAALHNLGCKVNAYETEAMQELLEQAGYRVTHTTLLQKEQAQMERELMHAADQLKVALVVTVGGTGIGPRDVTPEATAAVCPRMVPGLGEVSITKLMRRFKTVSAIRQASPEELAAVVGQARAKTLVTFLRKRVDGTVDK